MVDQKQLQTLEYFDYFGSMTTNDARCAWESKSGIAMEKTAFNKENSFFASRLDLNLRKKQTATFGGAETWTFQKVDQKYLESFEVWCWRRMKEINWTDHVRNEVLQRVKKEG
jgi:hypothetical protein